jgi:hypothetical protein
MTPRFYWKDPIVLPNNQATYLNGTKTHISSYCEGFFMRGTPLFLVLLIVVPIVVKAQKSQDGRTGYPLGVLPREACGIWCWYSTGGSPNRWTGKITAEETYPKMRGVPIVVGWNEIEPQDGVYRWELVDDIVRKAAANNKYVFTLLWLIPVHPVWLFEKGVPRVEINTFKEDTNFAAIPYPMDKKYKYYSERIIKNFADHIRGLPPELFKRVLFHQAVEGSTGDGEAYKGAPKDPKYSISAKEWAEYQEYIRKFTINAFQGTSNEKPPVSLLIHTEDVLWGARECEGLVVKQGVPSHFYGSNGSKSKFKIYEPFNTEDNVLRRPIFSRGEGETMWRPAKEWLQKNNVEYIYNSSVPINHWFQKDSLQNLYWSALNCLHCGLDIWNIPEHVLENPRWYLALDMFDKYAGEKYPQRSPVAFCALRDELNADDVKRFPEDKYGPATKKNKDRVLKIRAEFADHGAVVEDLGAALAGGLESRRRKGYNDVAWDRIDDDYCRYLYPIDKLETSVGWWHVGPRNQPYGRFARGFEHRTGKDTLFFKLHDRFFENFPAGQLTIRIVWLDNNSGSWKLAYDSGKEMKTALSVQGNTTGIWQEKTVTVTDAVMRHHGPRGSDIMLVNTDDKDDTFHIIEISREVPGR